MKFVFLVLFFCVSTTSAFAGEMRHQLFRKVAVFPIAEANYSTAEDAWWQMREVLTKDQKLLVATRRFMVNRGVFQPRKTLKPADVVILSKILDAQALVVSFLEDRVLHMKVYEGENGFLLWQGEAQAHPAIPVSDQIIKLSTTMMMEFMRAIPYQAYQVVDEVIGKPTYEDQDKTLARVFVGQGSTVKVGDPVQWVVVTGDPTESFFGPRTVVTVIAEGTVRQILNDQIEVEIIKSRDLSELKQDALVRFPQEIAQLRDLYSRGEKSSMLGSEVLSTDLKAPEELKKDHNSTSTALAFIANLAVMVLLAF